jgi:hypothetical protein
VREIQSDWKPVCSAINPDLFVDLGGLFVRKIQYMPAIKLLCVTVQIVCTLRDAAIRSAARIGWIVNVSALFRKNMWQEVREH